MVAMRQRIHRIQPPQVVSGEDGYLIITDTYPHRPLSTTGHDDAVITGALELSSEISADV
jgi:hypothetical protein